MKIGQKSKELHKIEDAISRCKKCPLHGSRTKAVPGEGSCPADLMLIGEAPGKFEDLQGRPFVGPSGRFLDNMLKGISMSRNQAYITSAVKCRPPKNRTPYADELRICKANWLDRQISLVDPKVIVLLGKTASKQLLGKVENIDRLHGRVFSINNRSSFVTFHPAAAMRFPRIKRKTQQDFNALKQLLPGTSVI